MSKDGKRQGTRYRVKSCQGERTSKPISWYSGTVVYMAPELCTKQILLPTLRCRKPGWNEDTQCVRWWKVWHSWPLRNGTPSCKAVPLATIQHRQKWLKFARNFAVNDMVLICDDMTPRSTWPLGRVIETTHGRDKRVRSVTIQNQVLNHQATRK